MALLQNSIDLVSIKCGCHSGMCATSSEFGNEVIHVQLDDVTEETEGEDCEPTTFSFMRTDPGVRDMPVECLVCFIGIQNYLSLYKSNPCETTVWPWGVVLSSRDDEVTRRLYL